MIPRVRLLLASASVARLATLRAAGVEPLILVSGVDEDVALTQAARRYGELQPADAALFLARAKCEDVAQQLRVRPPYAASTAGAPDQETRSQDREDTPVPDLVLGCDSLLELDGLAYGKPVDANDARNRWQSMSGRSGVLHTGHWLIDLRDETADGTGATFGQTVSTEVTFAKLDPDEIEAYVASGEPLACAGAFTIDALGGPFVSSLHGDHHNVLGLSLPALRLMVRELGIAWPTLWASRG